MNKHLFFASLSLCFIGQLYCSQALVVPKTYQGKEITTDSIPKLMPAAPEHLVKATESWLQENPQVAATALGYETFVPTAEITLDDGTKHKTIKPLLDATNVMLEQQGTKNLSPWNYVFQHPRAQDYLVKIGGHVNRKYNLSHAIQDLEMNGIWDANNNAQQGYNYNRALTEADYDRFEKELHAFEFDSIINNEGSSLAIRTAPKTYQTISRAAHYLLLLEAIKQQKLQTITAPEMYLLHIPGRPTDVSDRNYIVVEKKLDGLQEITALSEQQQKELEIAIKNTGIFSINTENCKVNSQGQIAILDFEQPNNSIPRHFFHQSARRFESNKQAGLNGLEDLKKKFNKQDTQS